MKSYEEFLQDTIFTLQDLIEDFLEHEGAEGWSDDLKEKIKTVVDWLEEDEQ